MNVLNKIRQISLVASVLFMSNQCSGMQPVTSVSQLTNGTVIAIQGPNGQYITYGNGEPLTGQPYSITGNQPYIPCWTWFSLSGTNPAYPVCQFTLVQNSDGSFTLTSEATDQPLQAITGQATAANPAFVLASGVPGLPANAENWNIVISGGQATLQNENTGFLTNSTGSVLRANGSTGTSFTIQIISSSGTTATAATTGATAAPVTTSTVKGAKGKKVAAATGTTGATSAPVTSGKAGSKKGKASTGMSTSGATAATSKSSGNKKGALAKKMAGTTGTP